MRLDAIDDTQAHIRSVDAYGAARAQNTRVMAVCADNSEHAVTDSDVPGVVAAAMGVTDGSGDDGTNTGAGTRSIRRGLQIQSPINVSSSEECST